jgi:N-ethylmaleimide reductase
MTVGPDLFSPVRLGNFALRNRIVMAPMTRARAGLPRVPNEIMATHYAQRAGAGLIITEATQISLQGTGSIFTPGIHSAEQIAGWREVTDAVHAAGGVIALQLWHVGRVSHSSMQQDAQAPVSPSAVHGTVNTFTLKGFERTSPPRALKRDEIAGVVEQFGSGARAAIEAGFDGVEIHASNGYLIDQFLRDGVNQRSDDYGGSVENRCRFLLEVTDAVIGAVGADCTAVRLSPFTVTWDCVDSDPRPLFLHAVRELEGRGLAFLEIVERMNASVATADGGEGSQSDFTPADVRSAYSGDLIVNGCYDRELAAEAVSSGHAQAVSCAGPYVSTPDLAERFAKGVPQNPEAPMTVLYGGGAEGYIDFPAMDDAS